MAGITQAEFKAHVDSRAAAGLTRTQIAAEIAIGRSTLFEYLKEGSVIPRKVELLCRAVQAGLNDKGDA